MPTLLQIVYIHGFQGTDTTFQSFPTHLQEYLSSNIPPHLDITIRSTLYPTYKSAKPISYATKNFIEWLSTQPPGPVILAGHSMGGLLAAEAATDPSNTRRPKRIIGVIAFDTPYLGMHPHVVVSGIASLFSKKDEKKPKEAKSERSMNQHPQVQIVNPEVTDDWEAFKREAHIRPSRSSARFDSSSHLSPPGTPASSIRSGSRSPSPSQKIVDHAVSFISAHSDEPLARWLRKHADNPISSAKRWVIEHFQFGVCMFDPSGLKTRYTRLVAWESDGGLWANYWTHTVQHTSDEPSVTSDSTSSFLDNDEALRVNGMLPSAAASDYSLPPTPSSSSAQSSSGSEDKHSDDSLHKHRTLRKNKKEYRGRHFVVLPHGLGNFLGGMNKWEKVPIAGVEDEVDAHTSIFMPQKNLEYDAFVRRVAEKVLGWCQWLPNTEYQPNPMYH